MASLKKYPPPLLENRRVLDVLINEEKQRNRVLVMHVSFYMLTPSTPQATVFFSSFYYSR